MSENQEERVQARLEGIEERLDGMEAKLGLLPGSDLWEKIGDLLTRVGRLETMGDNLVRQGERRSRALWRRTIVDLMERVSILESLQIDRAGQGSEKEV